MTGRICLGCWLVRLALSSPKEWPDGGSLVATVPGWTTQSTDKALCYELVCLCLERQMRTRRVLWSSLTNPGTHGPFSQHQIYRPGEREKGSKQSGLMVLKRASTFCLFPSFIPKQILVILQLSAHYSEGKHPSPSSLWSDFLSHSESPAFCLSLTFSAFHGLWASLSHVRFLTFFTWWLYFLGKVKEKTRPSTSPPTDTDFSAGSFRRSAHWL